MKTIHEQLCEAAGIPYLAGGPAPQAAAVGGAVGPSYSGEDLAEVVRRVLAGGTAASTGPATFREAVLRIRDCDALEAPLDRRSDAAASVPVYLGRVKRGGGRKALMTAMRKAGRVGVAPADVGEALPAVADVALPGLPFGTNLRVPPALALSVRMQQMEAAGDMEVVEDHPVLDMLDRPNPLTTTTWEQLVETLIYQRVAWGEVFLRPALRAFQRVRNPRIAPPELFLVEDPSQVTVVLNEARTRLAGYDYEPGVPGERVRVADGRGAEPAHAPDALVHLKDLDPLLHLRGRSHLRPLWVWSELYTFGARWNNSLIKNRSKPDGVLRRKNGLALGAMQAQRAREDHQAKHAGPENVGSPYVEGDLEWQRISLTPEEMDWGGAMGMALRRCCAGVKVDPLLVGVGEFSTYNNLETAAFRLYTEGALPDLAWLLAALNEEVLPLFDGGDDLVLWYDATEIPALQQNAKELAEVLEKSSWLTDGEKRVAQGYPAEKPAEKGQQTTTERNGRAHALPSAEGRGDGHTSAVPEISEGGR